MTVKTSRSNFAARFLDKCLVGGSGCWEWLATKNEHGYGRMMAAGRQQLATRLLWEHLYHPLTKDTCVLHRCDNPGCVNPHHLFLGTQLENMQDRSRKGRMARKLTDEAVRGIRTSLKTGKKLQRVIAKEFGVSQSLVSLINLGKYWRFVE